VNDAIFRAVNGLAGQWQPLDRFMAWSAHDLAYVLGVIAIAAWLVNRHLGRPLAVRVVLSVGISMLIVHLIQIWYVEPRPFIALADVHQLVPHSADASFPSDHVTATAAATGPFVWSRARLGVLLLAGALLIAIARVYVGVHYPFDVLAGLVIGLGVSYVLSRVRTPFDGIERWVVQRLPAWL
jgi:undecaprenyl-diphosphatase